MRYLCFNRRTLLEWEESPRGRVMTRTWRPMRQGAGDLSSPACMILGRRTGRALLLQINRDRGGDTQELADDLLAAGPDSRRRAGDAQRMGGVYAVGQNGDAHAGGAALHLFVVEGKALTPYSRQMSEQCGTVGDGAIGEPGQAAVGQQHIKRLLREKSGNRFPDGRRVTLALAADLRGHPEWVTAFKDLNKVDAVTPIFREVHCLIKGIEELLQEWHCHLYNAAAGPSLLGRLEQFQAQAVPLALVVATDVPQMLEGIQNPERRRFGDSGEDSDLL